MLSAKDRKFLDGSKTTVKDIIEILKPYSPEAKVGVDGDNYFYIHVESDGSAISFDSSSLDEYYEEIGSYDELPEIKEIFESL